MALQKVKDSMRDVTVVDGGKITTGAIPTAALSNVDLVEGTKGSDIASSSTMVIGTDGGYFDITGTTGITAMTVAAGRAFTLQFDGAVVLTNSSTLKLSGAANFTTAAGDHLTFISVAANDVRQIGFGLTDGGSPVAAAGGKIVQVVNVVDTAVGTTTTIFPADDTIGQSGEGQQCMTLAITPTNSSNKLFIQVVVALGSDGASNGTAALFQDSDSGAISQLGTRLDNSNTPWHFAFNHYMAAGTTSSTTFKVRAGVSNSATTTFNGWNGVRQQGGKSASSITIWEIEV